jgi:hypothetical protein
LQIPLILIRRRRTVAAAVIAAACLGAGSVAEAIPPGGPVDNPHGAQVTLDRAAVKKGGQIKVTGTNWQARGSRLYQRPVVTVKLDDLDILAVIPIKQKRFSAWVTIPRPVKVGRHWLRFLAAEPATSVKSKPFTVTR